MNKDKEPLRPSVVHRGELYDRITAEDYDEAIQALIDAKSQLEPDGDCCHVCTDSGHQAWQCRHNPLVRAREAVQLEQQWRCFHCDEVFTDRALAAEHFGTVHEERSAACVTPVVTKATGRERKVTISDKRIAALERGKQ